MDARAVVTPEVGNGLEVWRQAAGQPHQFDIALRFALQAPAGLDAVQVAVDVDLEQHRRVVRRPPGGRRSSTVEAQSSKIEFLDEGIDHAHRIVLGDEVVQTLRQQRHLAALLALNKSAHQQPPRGSCFKLGDQGRVFTQARPATGTWKVLATGEEGMGPTSMFAYLAEQRTLAGQPVPKPVAINSKRQVFCNYCGKKAGLFTGKDVHPHREDLHERRFWVCWPCIAWVGCHKEGEKSEPLGMLADEPLRKARIAAHNAFDPLWRNGEMSREDANAWLADAMGISALKCHIGWMDIDECWRVIDVMASRDSIPF